MPSLEIALFDIPSHDAIATLSEHASRLEVCGGPYSSGGVTPSADALVYLRHSGTTLPLHAMLRPRGGVFVYNAGEFRRMEADLKFLVQSGAHGIVFGILHPDNRIDEERTKTLCDIAKELGAPTTFHRAFDKVPDWREGMATLKRCGIDAVLTSGGEGNAIDNPARLKKIVKEGIKLGIEVIVGGGVRSSNVKNLYEETGAEWFHSGAVIDDSGDVNGEEFRRMRILLEEPL